MKELMIVVTSLPELKNCCYQLPSRAVWGPAQALSWLPERREKDPGSLYGWRVFLGFLNIKVLLNTQKMCLLQAQRGVVCLWDFFGGWVVGQSQPSVGQGM